MTSVLSTEGFGEHKDVDKALMTSFVAHLQGHPVARCRPYSVC